MKVLFNQTLKFNNINPTVCRNLKNLQVQDSTPSEPERNSASGLSLANFPNVNFRGMDPNKQFLLNQVKRLRCAYSGKIMICPFEAKELYAKLSRRPNAQSAINLLQNYESYMHDIESIIFDIIKEAPHKGKRNFQDILQAELPDSLARLKEKQIKILTKTDKLIEKISDTNVREQVREIRNQALESIENDTFNRKTPLEKIKKVKATGKDLNHIIGIYQSWYKSPSSSKDLDAFIVKYSKYSHDDIAKRLVSTAVATIEHIKPSSNNGVDCLSNYLVVSAAFNNKRHSMPLNEYIMLNSEIDIPANLQKYVDDVIMQVNNKKNPFHQKPYYPIAIIDTIAQETKGLVQLEERNLHVPKEVSHQKDLFAKKLSKKYKVNY